MEYMVLPEQDGMRLRDVLRRVMGVSYTAMKSAKWNGGITVDGVVTPVDAFVCAGQVVAIRFRENAPVYAVKPYDLPLTIAHEDDWLFVIDKPAPLASQSSALHPDDTLENALYAHLRCPADFVYRPVNRLDKGTSGLMIVAKDAHIQHRLQALLHTPEFIRTYQAVVEGCPDDDCGVIDAPIGKEDAASIRRIVTPSGKPSVTHYRVLKRGKRARWWNWCLKPGARTKFAYTWRPSAVRSSGISSMARKFRNCRGGSRCTPAP